jgi:hypothetical protein
MLRPSAAPRWKIAIKIFFPKLALGTANAIRRRKDGTAPTPNRLSPADLRKYLRVSFIRLTSGEPSF